MENFEYPKKLSRNDAMYREAKQISSDSAIFSSRKALLKKHFEEHPIYLDGSYYTHYDSFAMVEEKQLESLAEWRDCHYYQLKEYKGHRFFMMSGGRYD